MKKLFLKLIQSIMGKLTQLEHAHQMRPGVMMPSAASMPYFDFISRGGMKKSPNGFKSKLKFMGVLLPTMANSLRGNFKSNLSVKRNPAQPKNRASQDFIEEIKQFALQRGACMVGFTKLEPQYIFDHTAILYENAIVLAQEMDEDKIDLAPHFETELMVHKVYRELGEIANDMADFLRDKGFGAQSSVALRGTTVLPIMAQKANLGMVGRNGLLLTEKFGARIRLAAVYTSIDNLPFADSEINPNKWIRDYCDMCGICVRKCPPKALYEKPIKRPGGETYVDNNKCFPYFHENSGCAVCIKVCPFSKPGFKVNKEAMYEILNNK